MKRLGLSALAFVGLAALVVGITAYRRAYRPTWNVTRYDREPY